MHIAICGATGALGSNLTRRLVAAGHTVTIGSRSLEKAAGVVAEMGLEGVNAAENPDACAAGDLVVISVPWDGAAALAARCAEHLDGKVVVSVVNALQFVAGEPIPLTVPTGSVAAAIQLAAPGARVVAALHHVPATELGLGDDADVLVCGDDRGAKKTVCELLTECGLRALDAGPLALAAPIEAFTAVILSLNKIHGGRARLRLLGLGGHD